MKSQLRTILCLLLCLLLLSSCGGNTPANKTSEASVDVKGSVSLGSLSSDGYTLSARHSDFSGSIVKLTVVSGVPVTLSSRYGLLVTDAYEISSAPQNEVYAGDIEVKFALDKSDGRIIEYTDSLLIGSCTDGEWSFFRPVEVTDEYVAFRVGNDGVYAAVYAFDSLMSEICARTCGEAAFTLEDAGLTDWLLALGRTVFEGCCGGYEDALDAPVRKKLLYRLALPDSLYPAGVLDALSSAYAESLTYNAQTSAFLSSTVCTNAEAASALKCVSDGEPEAAAVYFCSLFAENLDYDALSALCDKTNEALLPDSRTRGSDSVAAGCAADFIGVLGDKSLLQRGKYDFGQISVYERINDLLAVRCAVISDLNFDFESAEGTTSVGELLGMLVYVRVCYNEDTYNACIKAVKDGSGISPDGTSEQTGAVVTESQTGIPTSEQTSPADTSAQTTPADTTPGENLVIPPLSLQIQTLSRVTHKDDAVVYKLDMSKYAFIDSALFAAGKMKFSSSILGSFSISVPDYTGKDDVFDIAVSGFVISGTYSELSGTGSCAVSFTVHITCEEDGETGGYLITYSGKGKIAAGLYSDGGYYLSFTTSGTETTVGEGMFKGDNSKSTESVDFALQIN